METILRAAAIYLFLLIVFRMAGKRSLGQVTTFDFVLLLIIAEVTQQALISQDYSVTNAFLLILTLVAIDIGLSLLKPHYKRLDMLVEGRPMLLVEDGRLLRDRMARELIGEDDILMAARELQGLERLDQIKYAVLERSGGISIVPKQANASG